MEARIRKALELAFDLQTSTDAVLHNLGGQASLRIYWRIESPSIFNAENTLIAMVLPQDQSALTSDEGGSSSDPVPEELPFVSVQRYLKRLGIRVPEIAYINMDLGVLLLEDLGITMFENRILDEPDATENLYREAIDLLVDFQNASMKSSDKSCICWEKAFDKELLNWELDHYIEWGIDAVFDDTDFFDGAREEVSTKFSKLVDELVALPQALVFRDYQSRNIMWKKNEWVAIDFQDALRGPFIYDLVALLRDSYIELAPDLVARLVDYYAEQDLPWELSKEEIHHAFHLQTLQRKLKDTGRFIYIDQVKGNDSFLQYYAPSLQYVKNALENLPFKEDSVWNKIVQNG